jgi:hypothetical protein
MLKIPARLEAPAVSRRGLSYRSAEIRDQAFFPRPPGTNTAFAVFA